MMKIRHSMMMMMIIMMASLMIFLILDMIMVMNKYDSHLKILKSHPGTAIPDTS